MNGLIGKKIGMTHVFAPDGKMIPVTVVQVGPCVVTQVKTPETDGYAAIQLGFDEIPAKRLNRPIAGHLKKSTEKGFRVIREFRVQEPSDVVQGSVLDTQIFTIGEKVTVSGVSKGRGFQGTIKRHKFSRGPETHGNRNHRKPGSIGNSAWPSKVIKGKKMPGQMGNTRETVKNLTIVDIRPNENIMLIKGAVPGFNSSILEIKKTGK
jgi:large subunit ribosomal protein L3